MTGGSTLSRRVRLHSRYDLPANVSGVGKAKAAGLLSRVCRELASYQDQFPEHHSVNQAFLRFCEIGGQSGILHDLESAREIVRIYGEFVPDRPLQIVQHLAEGEAPLPGAEFLGYDVSIDGGALQSHGLIVGQWHSRPSDEPLAHVWQPLSEVTHRYFGEQLNEHGLFPDLATAKFFQACIFALEEIRPCLYTGDEVGDARIPPWKLFLVPS
jgi:hypothetical protein